MTVPNLAWFIHRIVNANTDCATAAGPTSTSRSASTSQTHTHTYKKHSHMHQLISNLILVQRRADNRMAKTGKCRKCLESRVQSRRWPFRIRQVCPCSVFLWERAQSATHFDVADSTHLQREFVYAKVDWVSVDSCFLDLDMILS